MSQFSLLADFNTIIWPRIVLGVGMGFLFIPLTTLTMSGIKKEDMGNASAIYNLLRNLGGSFGVAFVTTIIARRAQFHQARLVDHLTPFDRTYQLAVDRSAQVLQQKGLAPALADQGALASLYGRLMKQASMLSFNDAFFLLSVFMVFILPLVFFMKKGRTEPPGGMH